MAYGAYVSKGYAAGTATDSLSAVDLARAAIGGLTPMVQEVTHEITSAGALIKQVTTPGTRVRLSASSLLVRRAFCQALSTNTDVVVVGDSTVVAALGTQASPTQKGVELGARDWWEIPFDDLTDLWLDSLYANDGVKVVYLT